MPILNSTGECTDSHQEGNGIPPDRIDEVVHSLAHQDAARHSCIKFGEGRVGKGRPIVECGKSKLEEEREKAKYNGSD